MKRVVLFYLTITCLLCGCLRNKTAEVKKRELLPGDVAWPFFDYGQTLLSETRRFNLGDIPPEVRKIIATIPVSNPGNGLLIIEKVDGSCACFSGWDGDKQIAPGQFGAINVFFDKDKIESGLVTRFVHIKTNDPANSEVQVFFDFNVIRSPEEEEIRLLRGEIQNLKNDLQAFRKEVGQWKSQSQSARPSTAAVEDPKIYDIPAGNSPVLGSKDAAVTIVEFSDFQCPFCIKEYPTLKQILSEYPGKVRLVFKHFPLGFHKQSPAAHAMTELALRQKGNDTFWKLCEMIQAEPKRLDSAALKIYAQALGMDTAQLDKTWSDEKAMAELLKADKDLAAKCNVGGTPTIFINGKNLADRSMDGYHNRIDSILASEGKIVSRAK
jgi:protein-disulfide isomerase